MLGFFIGFLTAVLVLVCLLTVLIVLMQRPKQEGLGAAFGGGVTDQMFGAQTSNVLQRGTVYLAVLFFVITLILAVLVNAKQKGSKDTMEGLAETSDPSAPADSSSSVTSPTPELGTTPPLIENLGSGDTTTPSFDEIKLTPDETPAPAPGDASAPGAGAAAPGEGAPTTVVEDAAAAAGAGATDVADEVEKLLEEVEAAAGDAAPDVPKPE